MSELKLLFKEISEPFNDRTFIFKGLFAVMNLRFCPK